MRFVSISDYNHDSRAASAVDDILAGDDHVVMTYVEGFYLCPVVDLVTIATTPTGTLILLDKTGIMTTFNTTAADCRAQRVPLEMFFQGPSDGNEIFALWNEFKHRRDRESVDAAAERGEA